MTQEAVLAKVIELGNSVNELKASQKDEEIKRTRLEDVLELHMKHEEVIQTQIMQAVEQLKDIVSDINSKEHSKHHQFIDKYIEEQEHKRQFWCGVKDRVVSGTIWGILVGMVGVGVFAFQEWVRLIKG